MSPARIAAIITWVYAAGFGLGTIPVGIHLARRGSLPSFLGLFPAFGGPWSARMSTGAFEAALGGFLLLMVVVAWSGWLVWQGSKAGAILNLGLIPIEAVFWYGFALPIPVIVGIARVSLLIVAWDIFD